jgi:hypothetical protein
VSVDATAADDTFRKAMLVMKGAPLLPLPGNNVYGRFMIWTERVPDATVHWTFAHADGTLDGKTANYNYGGMGKLMANYYRDTDPAVDCWQNKEDQNLPTGDWACVAFQLDGGNHELRFWLNDVEVPELHVVGMEKTDATCTEAGVDGRWLAPLAFTTVSVGWESYQHDAMGAHSAWIDDVAFDDEPIACPK